MERIAAAILPAAILYAACATLPTTRKLRVVGQEPVNLGANQLCERNGAATLSKKNLAFPLNERLLSLDSQKPVHLAASSSLKSHRQSGTLAGQRDYVSSGGSLLWAVVEPPGVDESAVAAQDRLTRSLFAVVSEIVDHLTGIQIVWQVAVHRLHMIFHP